MLFHKVWRILYHTSQSSQCWSLYDNMMKHWTLCLTWGGFQCIQSPSSVILVHGDHRLMIRLLVWCLISWKTGLLVSIHMCGFHQRRNKRVKVFEASYIYDLFLSEWPTHCQSCFDSWCSYTLDGVPRMRERPIQDLVDGLKQWVPMSSAFWAQNAHLWR